MKLEDEINRLKIKAIKIKANYEHCGDDKECIKRAISFKEEELRKIQQSATPSLSL